jgi:hypothetical protein
LSQRTCGFDPRPEHSRRLEIQLRRHALVLFSALAAFIAAGCDNGFVPDDQVSYKLFEVDGKPLPVSLQGGINGSVTIRTGTLLGTPSGDSCEYHVQVESGNSFTNIEGPVFNCTLEETGEIIVRIDVGQSLGPHDFLFSRS